MPEALSDRRRVLVGAAVLVVVLALAGRTLLRPAHPAVRPPVRVAAPARTTAVTKLYVNVVAWTSLSGTNTLMVRVFE